MADPGPSFPAWHVQGRVHHAADGRPVPRFAILLLPRDPDPAHEAQELAEGPAPDATRCESVEGRFIVPADSAVPATLFLWPEDALPCAVTVTPRSSVGPEDPIAIAVHAGVRVRGLVLAAEQGPLAEAWLTLRNPVGVELAATSSDADGRFELGPVAPGEYALVVTAMARPAWCEPHLLLSGAAPVQELRIEIPCGAALFGRVVPVPPAPAELVLFAADGSERRASIAADGGYELEGLRAGRHRAFVERHEGSAAARVARLVAEAGAAPDVELRAGERRRFDVADPVASLARVRGRAIDSAWPAARVRAVPLERDFTASLLRELEVALGADLVFELPALPPGRYRVELVDESGTVRGSTLLELAPGAQCDGVTLREGAAH